MSQGFTKGIPIDYDGTLSSNSDLLVPSQKAVKTYTDTGLATKQDTLTGSESVLLPDRLLFKQNTTIAHTGVTGETVIATYLVPANTIQANDILKWLLYYTMTNNANAKVVNCYFNTTADLSGTPIQVATRTLVSNAGTPIGRELVCNNSQTSQRILNVPSSFGTTENTTVGTMTTTSIDFTVNQYFVITANLSTGTDVISLQYLFANLMR
jgi:hypothetical protein